MPTGFVIHICLKNRSRKEEKMEGICCSSSTSSSKAQFKATISLLTHHCFSTSKFCPVSFVPVLWRSKRDCKRRTTASSLRTTAFMVEEAIEKPNSREAMPKIDKSGRFCSPRAARELALLICYAACLEGSDPIRLFEKRMNIRRESGYEFDKASLLEFNHMSFGGPPVKVETVEEADELVRCDEKQSAIEAEVLSAPPKLVYSKLLLRFTRKLLVAIVDRWNNHVLVIDKIAPPNWKNEPAGRILELCILHLAMSEIAVLGTRHPIVINEAVDLAKRFCDGAAPRIINGCLRTFVKDFTMAGGGEALEAKQQIAVEV